MALYQGFKKNILAIRLIKFLEGKAWLLPDLAQEESVYCHRALRCLWGEEEFWSNVFSMMGQGLSYLGTGRFIWKFKMCLSITSLSSFECYRMSSYILRHFLESVPRYFREKKV